jgi:BirA family transcriptional regulator, biotin operon repressor / biotin---[acetyl-CoA-carboxylase] ligase
MFDFSALEAELAETIFAGKVHFAAVTESTNNDALAAARSGAPHGSVWFADEQLAGRGRGGNAWRSAAGEGLYVSTLLRLSIPTDRLLLLPLAAGLAAANAIRKVCGLQVDLRWPNDLLLDEKKTGGILVEATSESSGSTFAVVGIGINVHQTVFAPGLATPATSLDLEAGRVIDRQALLLALLMALEQEAKGLLDPAAARTIPEQIEAKSSWVRGRAVEVHGPQECAGITAGLDEHGFLLVETASGKVVVQTGGIRSSEIH